MQVADFDLKVSESSYLSFITSDGIKADIALSLNIGIFSAPSQYIVTYYIFDEFHSDITYS